MTLLDNTPQDNTTQCSHEEAYRFGTYTHINGTTQRYQCKSCGVVFSEHQISRLPTVKVAAIVRLLYEGVSLRKTALLTETHFTTVWRLSKIMNKLPEPKSKAIEAMLASGISIRSAANISGSNKNTVSSIFKRTREARKRPPGRKRIRAAYTRAYYARQAMNHYQLTQRNDIIRATICLWLAKNRKPLSIEQIFSAMKPQFPHLKLTALSYMLNRNADHSFKRVRNKFTYEPSEFYHPAMSFRPGKQPGTYTQLMNAARATWFRVRGIKDEAVEETIARLKMENEKFIRRRQLEAIKATMPVLQLMAAASAVTQYETDSIKPKASDNS